MTILDRYVFKQLMVITLFAVLIFSIAWIAPEIMFQAIKEISEGQFTVGQGLAYLVYQIPQVLTYCLPIAMLFASVFLFRHLSLSNELTAFFVSGVSFRRVLVPVAAVGAIVMGGFILNQEMFYPWAAHNLKALNAQTHFNDNLVVNPNMTFLERAPGGQIQKFLILLPEAKAHQNKYIVLFYRSVADGGGIQNILTATDGQWDNGLQKWVFHQGREYWLDKEGVYRNIEQFDTRQVVTSPVAHQLFNFPVGKAYEYPTVLLWEYVHLLKAGGQLEDAKFFNVRLDQRFIQPWAVVMFALLGAAIGIEHARSRRNMSLTYAALVLLLYNVLIPTFTIVGNIGMLPPFVASVIPLLVAGGMGLGIIKLRTVLG